jgi:ferrochelatase
MYHASPDLSTPRTAIVLFNLGGPDSPEAVKPFLANLFKDKRIIGLPNPFRWLLAQLIAARRAPIAQKIYAHLGGRSPILENTQAQAAELEATLGEGFKAFIAMRYWHPMAAETARAVAAWQPDRIVLLPLYPQYSTTTNRSSFEQWAAELKRTGCRAPSATICCYPDEPGLITAIARLTNAAYDRAARAGTPRVLFSAHGLPEKIIARGDPYQWQCERTAAAIAAVMNRPDMEWLNTYQSRVGPLQWIKPATDAEIERAGHEKRPLVVVPIAFVSEHSETLVELDIEYGELAKHAGVPAYERVATASIEPEFIAGLARLVRQALDHPHACQSLTGGRICPAHYSECPMEIGK